MLADQNPEGNSTTQDRPPDKLRHLSAVSVKGRQIVALYGECAYDQKDIQAIGYLAHEGR